MKTLSLIALIVFCSFSAFGQSVWGETQFATILPALNGGIIQYAFPVTPFVGAWFPTSHQKKFTFSGTHTAAIQTVDGVTELYLHDEHDICGFKGGSCSFLGTLSLPFEITSVPFDGGIYQHVVGEFYGTFTDETGLQWPDVIALFSLDTFPADDPVDMPSVGSVVIVYKLN